MSLVVEDGSGSATADSYIGVADADTYMENHFAATHTWLATATTQEKERYLRKAALYLDNRYLYRWAGRKFLSAQRLQWPRAGAYDPDGYSIEGIPEALQIAQVEVARRYAEGTEVNPDLRRGDAVKRKKAGPVEIEYFEGAPPGLILHQIEQILGPLIGPANQVVLT